MAEIAEGPRRQRLRRLRWRRRGAWLWPAFAVATVVEAGLLHWLPVAGEGSGFVAALLLAGCLNVVAVALLGRLGGFVLRRRRRDLPTIVAEDYAGLTALGVVAVSFLVAGLVHRPELQASQHAFAEQSAAVRLWVDANGDAFARAHVDRADSVVVDVDLYRTCVPRPDPRSWQCLIVDTSHRPPRITPDRSWESNASQDPRGVFR
ncbi:MAG: hypothetical protein Q8O56_11660 [Solirubrobacteraceae bacterium]|nr:hypothetical protein [Solirubrobacteraceae bacterium]